MGGSETTEDFDDLAERLLHLHREGGTAAIDEFRVRRPDLAAEIDDILPALLFMEDLARPESDGAGGGTAAPERIGDFRIIREVGRGGMGIVFEAEQISLGRRVALKLLPPHVFLDEKQLIRFQQEARSAARLQHENIVPVYGLGERDGLHYFVMQFVDGQGLDGLLDDLRRELRDADATEGAATEQVSNFYSLGQAASSTSTRGVKISRPRPRSSESSEVDSKTGAGRGRLGTEHFLTSATLCLQVAEALSHAHEAGVLHRDIKPSNLLIDGEGKVWVSDFGLAKAQDTGDLTMSGEVVGTPLYMPPERFDGRGDARSDVYAVGLVLYELSTLERAFEGGDRVQVIRRILYDTPTPPRRLESRMPRDLETIIQTAIAKNPNERYATASALADDLRAFLEGAPIKARRVGLGERAVKWVRRHPVVAMLALGLVLVTLLAVVVVLVFNLRHGAQLSAALEESDRNYRAARTLVEKMSDLGDERLRDLPRSEQLSRELLEDSVEFYERAIAEGEVGTEVLLMSSDALFRLGAICLRQGEIDIARQRLLQGAAIVGRVMAKDPSQAASRQMSRCQTLVAETYSAKGDVVAARRAFDLALEITRGLVSAHPEAEEYRTGLAEILNNKGAMVGRQSPDEAVGLYEEAVALVEGTSGPEAQRMRSRLATFKANLSGVLARVGEVDRARKLLDAAVEEMRELVLEEPRNVERRQSYAHSQIARARFGWLTGELETGETSYRTGIRIFDGLIRDFPLNARLRERRSAHLSDLGALMDDSAPPGPHARHEAAQECFRRSIEDQTFLVETLKLDQPRVSLARSWANLGRAHFLADDGSKRDFAAAEAAWRESVKVLEGCSEQNRSATFERGAIGSQLGVVLHRLERFDEAEKVLTSAIATLEEALRGAPRQTEYQHALAGAFNNLGELVRDRGRPFESCEIFARGIELQNSALEANPTNPAYRLFHRNLHWNLARAYLRSGDHESAADVAEQIPPVSRTEDALGIARMILQKCAAAARRDEGLDEDERAALVVEYGRRAKSLASQD